MTAVTSRTGAIRQAAADDTGTAQVMLADLVADLFGERPEDVRINSDQYSLNSLNGTLLMGGRACFFKFHQEEGEEEMGGEYYRAGLLQEAGLPVDAPLMTSTVAGEQILIYRRRDDPRFSDVLTDLDAVPDTEAEARAVAAEAALNDDLLTVAQGTLHPITPEMSSAEPIHRLFHARLSDPDGTFPGGRFAAFYAGRTIALPGLDVRWGDLAWTRPVLNGVPYTMSLGELFDAAHDRLDPYRLADAGGITAHGDAHNANVWYERGEAGDRLRLFDPAFAGNHVPSLLAEVKSTFHNVFAHPLWLYQGSEVTDAAFPTSVRLDGDRLYIETAWRPTDLRLRLLDTKARHFWAPFLRTLRDRDLLPDDWEAVLRLALFLCPTLVMNLNASAGRHSRTSSAIGLAVALGVGAAPEDGSDIVTDFMETIRPT